MMKFLLFFVALINFSTLFSSEEDLVASDLVVSDMDLRTILAEGAMYQTIKGWKIEGIDRLSALTQGVGFDGKTPYFGLVAYTPFSKIICLNALSQESRSFVEGLPQFPKELKEDGVVIRVFIFFAEAFGKEEEPCYLYASRKLSDNDVQDHFMTNEDMASACTGYSARTGYEERIQHLRNICHGFHAVEQITKLEELDQLDEMTKGEEQKDFREKYLRNLKVLSDTFNSAHAQALLGYAYEKGLFSLEVSEDLAVKYYTKSADGGYSFGRGALGEKLHKLGQNLLAEDGLYEGGVALIKYAFPHLKASAAAGNIQHSLMCAELLYKGIGCTRDLSLAQSYHNQMAQLIDAVLISEWKEDKDSAKLCIRSQLFIAVMYLKNGSLSEGSTRLERIKAFELQVFFNNNTSKDYLIEFMRELNK